MNKIKLLKNGKLSKVSLKNIDFKNLNYYNSNDIGRGSVGILRLCIFTGSFRNAKFSHYEYYLAEVVNDNHTVKDSYTSFQSTTHRFTITIREVISGSEKKVGDKFTKRGKNLYGNYHEIERADSEELKYKHDRKTEINETKLNYIF